MTEEIEYILYTCDKRKFIKRYYYNQ